MFNSLIGIFFFAVNVLLAEANTGNGPYQVHCWSDEVSFLSASDRPKDGFWLRYYAADDRYVWHLLYSGDSQLAYENTSSDSDFIKLERVGRTFFNRGDWAIYDIKNKTLSTKRHGHKYSFQFCTESYKIDKVKHSLAEEQSQW